MAGGEWAPTQRRLPTCKRSHDCNPSQTLHWQYFTLPLPSGLAINSLLLRVEITRQLLQEMGASTHISAGFRPARNASETRHKLKRNKQSLLSPPTTFAAAFAATFSAIAGLAALIGAAAATVAPVLSPHLLAPRLLTFGLAPASWRVGFDANSRR